jgi:hypothetical protein
MNVVIHRLLSLTASLLVGLTMLLAAPRPAGAAVPNVWAFAYNDNPTPPPASVMNPAYQWGSFKTTCPGSMATITQVAVGKYVVTFPCSASSNGIVHVTAVNNNARYCEIEGWSDVGAAKAVTVLCFKGPAADNSMFTVTYTTSSGAPAGGAHAYVFSSPTGVVIAGYNSAGPANSVTHVATGRWDVKLPLLSTGTYDGDLQATAVHPNDAPRRCKIDNWINVTPDYRVQISCTDPNGVLVDTWFTVSYHFKRSVAGTAPGSLAYMTNLPGAPPGSDYNPVAPPNAFTSTPPGRYTTVFPGVGTGATHMQVTALGGPFGYYCQLERIWTIAGGTVTGSLICFNNVGVTTDNLLFATYTSQL